MNAKEDFVENAYYIDSLSGTGLARTALKADERDFYKREYKSGITVIVSSIPIINKTAFKYKNGVRDTSGLWILQDDDIVLVSNVHKDDFKTVANLVNTHIEALFEALVSGTKLSMSVHNATYKEICMYNNFTYAVSYKA